ncbi:RidA family protein [Pseudomonas sp. PDNC002]|uniref:RidA family protein n=1 Tax=Pseudomonas sp. PDNC002 TaxID=2811422 RepID=UPI0019652025|nr:RidA family protein [Pseudomonas sp. PDNC002]QRY82418.1 RidA family protein [Pseudomonas sp. PDNC002]
MGKSLLALPTLALLAATLPAHAADVIRYKLPDSNFPIALAVEVPEGYSEIHVSGLTPGAVPQKDPSGATAVYGDTKTQTISVLKSIEQTLKSMGLGMGDVVKMQAYLVADPQKGERMDFAGFMDGYNQFFGTPAQPKVPARSAIQVAGLFDPAWLVEIEVTAVRKKR